MAARKKKTELCGTCFPYGLDDQPADATQVSCAHGSWDVEQPKQPETPVTQPDEGGSGDGQGDDGDGDDETP